MYGQTLMIVHLYKSEILYFTIGNELEEDHSFHEFM